MKFLNLKTYRTINKEDFIIREKYVKGDPANKIKTIEILLEDYEALKSKALYGDSRFDKKIFNLVNSSIKQFNMNVENTELPILILDKEQIIYGNQAFLDILGYKTLSEFNESSLWDSVAEESQKTLKEIIHQPRYKKDYFAKAEIKMIHKSGMKKDLKVTFRAEKIKDNYYLRCNILDISELKDTMDKLKKVELKLKKQNLEISESNRELQETLDKAKKDKRELERLVDQNINDFVLPTVRYLQKRYQDEELLELLEETSMKLVSPISDEMKELEARLSPKEIQICNMIKNGLKSKEIATHMKIDSRTVDCYRNSIRRKLDIAHENVSLKKYLRSI